MPIGEIRVRIRRLTIERPAPGEEPAAGADLARAIGAAIEARTGAAAAAPGRLPLADQIAGAVLEHRLVAARLPASHGDRTC